IRAIYLQPEDIAHDVEEATFRVVKTTPVNIRYCLHLITCFVVEDVAFCPGLPALVIKTISEKILCMTHWPPDVVMSAFETLSHFTTLWEYIARDNKNCPRELALALCRYIDTLFMEGNFVASQFLIGKAYDCVIRWALVGQWIAYDRDCHNALISTLCRGIGILDRTKEFSAVTSAAQSSFNAAPSVIVSGLVGGLTAGGGGGTQSGSSSGVADGIGGLASSFSGAGGSGVPAASEKKSKASRSVSNAASKLFPRIPHVRSATASSIGNSSSTGGGSHGHNHGHGHEHRNTGGPGGSGANASGVSTGTKDMGFGLPTFATLSAEMAVKSAAELAMAQLCNHLGNFPSFGELTGVSRISTFWNEFREVDKIVRLREYLARSRGSMRDRFGSGMMGNGGATVMIPVKLTSALVIGANACSAAVTPRVSQISPILEAGSPDDSLGASEEMNSQQRTKSAAPLPKTEAEGTRSPSSRQTRNIADYKKYLHFFAYDNRVIIGLVEQPEWAYGDGEDVALDSAEDLGGHESPRLESSGASSTHVAENNKAGLATPGGDGNDAIATENSSAAVGAVGGLSGMPPSNQLPSNTVNPSSSTSSHQADWSISNPKRVSLVTPRSLQGSMRTVKRSSRGRNAPSVTVVIRDGTGKYTWMTSLKYLDGDLHGSGNKSSVQLTGSQVMAGTDLGVSVSVSVSVSGSLLSNSAPSTSVAASPSLSGSQQQQQQQTQIQTQTHHAPLPASSRPATLSPSATMGSDFVQPLQTIIEQDPQLGSSALSLSEKNGTTNTTSENPAVKSESSARNSEVQDAGSTLTKKRFSFTSSRPSSMLPPPPTSTTTQQPPTAHTISTDSLTQSQPPETQFHASESFPAKTKYRFVPPAIPYSPPGSYVVRGLPAFNEDAIPTLDHMLDSGSERIKSFYLIEALTQRQIAKEKELLAKSALEREKESVAVLPPPMTDNSSEDSLSQVFRLFMTHFGFLSLKTQHKLMPLQLTEQLINDLEKLDRLPQDTVEEILQPKTISRDFDEFMHSIAWPVDIETHPGYKGNLSPQTCRTAPYFANRNVEIVFHSPYFIQQPPSRLQSTPQTSGAGAARVSLSNSAGANNKSETASSVRSSLSSSLRQEDKPGGSNNLGRVSVNSNGSVSVNEVGSPNVQSSGASSKLGGGIGMVESTSDGFQRNSKPPGTLNVSTLQTMNEVMFNGSSSRTNSARTSGIFTPNIPTCDLAVLHQPSSPTSTLVGTPDFVRVLPPNTQPKAPNQFVEQKVSDQPKPVNTPFQTSSDGAELHQNMDISSSFGPPTSAMSDATAADTSDELLSTPNVQAKDDVSKEDASTADGARAVPENVSNGGKSVVQEATDGPASPDVSKEPVTQSTVGTSDSRRNSSPQHRENNVSADGAKNPSSSPQDSGSLEQRLSQKELPQIPTQPEPASQPATHLSNSSSATNNTPRPRPPPLSDKSNPSTFSEFKSVYAQVAAEDLVYIVWVEEFRDVSTLPSKLASLFVSSPSSASTTATATSTTSSTSTTTAGGSAAPTASVLGSLASHAAKTNFAHVGTPSTPIKHHTSTPTAAGGMSTGAGIGAPPSMGASIGVSGATCAVFLFVHPLQDTPGLYWVKTSIVSSAPQLLSVMEDFSFGPLVDGTIVSRHSLGLLVRHTAISAHMQCRAARGNYRKP
ncbi:Ral GTPase-activating protein subunit alpha-1, partial [Quaeritorhiza haematococci]